MAAYYNEIDHYAAQWLRNLIAAGNIAPGDVDERSIEDVFPSDLAGYSQCHFFAGIGGWSCALRLAGWPDDRPVWTGSCPCQPFSAAGKRSAFADERHLWPAWHHLISQCEPAVVLGEQVASPAGYAWLDLVQTDLEGTGYAFGPVVLPAAGVGAPHGRHRIFFVANANGLHSSAERQQSSRQHRQQQENGSACCGLDNPKRERLEGHRADQGQSGRHEETGSASAAGVLGAWHNAEWIKCRDGKTRPTQPGLLPLAHGVPNRVGRLRAYGNAIVPQVAEVLIRAYLESGYQGNQLKCTA